MRSFVVFPRLAVLSPVFGAVLAAQMPECLVRLEPPSYPPFSWGAENDLPVTVEAKIQPDGRAEPLFAGSDDDLDKEAWRVVTHSTFSTACAGRTVEITFEFQLRGEKSTERKTEVEFGTKSEILVFASPPGSLCERTVTNETEAAECFGQGTHLADQNRYQEAIDRKLAVAPEAEAYIKRGIARRKTRQFEAAIEDYDQAIRLKPDSAVAYFDRGNANRDLGRAQDAIRDYSATIRIDPKHPGAYGNRANRYAALGLYAQAQADYGKVIELWPDDGMAYSNRGVTYLRTNQYTRAITDFDEAIRLSPSEPEAYNNKGAALFPWASSGPPSPPTTKPLL